MTRIFGFASIISGSAVIPSVVGISISNTTTSMSCCLTAHRVFAVAYGGYDFDHFVCFENPLCETSNNG